MLDFSSLGKTAQFLAEALEQMAARPKDLLARDGCIQHKQTEAMSDTPGEVDGLGFKDMIRLAHERQLLDDPVAWFGYRELRNISTHVYDVQKAALLYDALPNFSKDALALSARLHGLQASPP